MAEKLDPRHVVTFEELLRPTYYTLMCIITGLSLI